jgi:hypothetical protein
LFRGQIFVGHLLPSLASHNDAIKASQATFLKIRVLSYKHFPKAKSMFQSSHTVSQFRNFSATNTFGPALRVHILERSVQSSHFHFLGTFLRPTTIRVYRHRL